ncbi:MAG: hypothetical protein K2K88_05530, partial [Muribaculaceae bacterium]|nr:hypothetical protein [Muribaculaceae bacterium]
STLNKILILAVFRLCLHVVKEIKEWHIKTVTVYHILVELPFASNPGNEWVDSILFEIESRGFKPILAHPERYLYLHTRDLKNYIDLHNRGVEFQINLLSLAGYHGEDENKMALKLIDKGLVDYCATDLHHFRHVDSIEKYLSSRACRPTLKKLAALVKNDKL